MSIVCTKLVSNEVDLPRGSDVIHSYAPLDQLFIVDSVLYRAELERTLLSGIARNIVFAPQNNGDTPLDQLLAQIEEQMREGSAIGVITGVNGVRDGIFQRVIEIGNEIGLGSRRIMWTCKTEGEVRSECRKHNLKRNRAFMRVGFETDNAESIESLQRQFGIR